MNTAPETFPPDPEDASRFVDFLKESAHTAHVPPPRQVAEWKLEILATAMRAADSVSEKSIGNHSPSTLVPIPLRIAWAALWITAAGLQVITPDSPINTPPVRRPSAATFQQLCRNCQSLRTITPLVRFHTLKRELQLR